MRRNEDEGVLRENSHMAEGSQKWKVGLQKRNVSGGLYDDGGLGIDGEVGGAALETLKQGMSCCMQNLAEAWKGGSQG